MSRPRSIEQSTEHARRGFSPELPNFLRYWGPLLLWIAIVLAASSDPFSAQHTRVVLMKIWMWVNGSVDLRIFNQVHFLIRKSAHVTEYGILSALCFRALRGRMRGMWQARWMLPAIIAPLLVAITDEWHQSFVPSRGSSGWDVLIDVCGACAAQIIIWVALRSRTTVSSL